MGPGPPEPQEGTPRLTTLAIRNETVTHGGWAGQLRTGAVRVDGRKSGDAQSWSRVTAVARHGSVAIYLRWQGPAGADLAASVAAGRAAVTRTLDALSLSG